jgi:hypothetical protein
MVVEVDMRHLKKSIWPHRVNFPDIQRYYEIREWLTENIGLLYSQWTIVERRGTLEFYFKDGAHATMFILRWL